MDVQLDWKAYWGGHKEGSREREGVGERRTDGGEQKEVKSGIAKSVYKGDLNLFILFLHDDKGQPVGSGGMISFKHQRYAAIVE